MSSTTTNYGYVWGLPKMLLRIEALLLFAASIIVFALQGLDWWIYPLLVLLPDVFMVGYLKSTKLGAIVYNIGHSTPVPAILLGLGLLDTNSWLIALAAIWFGHIGWDRLLGYGLKYNDSFKHTHLSDLTKPART